MDSYTVEGGCSCCDVVGENSDCPTHGLATAWSLENRAPEEWQEICLGLEREWLAVRHQSIAPYVEALREAREAIAPFAYAAFEANGYPDEEAFTLTLRPDDEDGLREEGDEPESLLTARQLRATRAALAKIDALLSQQEASNG